MGARLGQHDLLGPPVAGDKGRQLSGCRTPRGALRDQHALDRADRHLHAHELARQDQAVWVGELPAIGNSPRGRGHLPSRRDHLAGFGIGLPGFKDQLGLAPVRAPQDAGRALFAVAQDAGAGLRDIDIDRVQLRDRGQRLGLAGGDKIADRDLGDVGNAVDGAADLGPVHGKLRLCPVGFGRRQAGARDGKRHLRRFQFGLADAGALQAVIAADGRAGALDGGLGAGDGGAGRGQRRLELVVVQAEQHGPRLDGDAGLIGDLGDLAADLRADGGFLIGHGPAGQRDGHGHRFAFELHHADLARALRAGACGAGGGLGRAGIGQHQRQRGQGRDCRGPSGVESPQGQVQSRGHGASIAAVPQPGKGTNPL